MATVKVNLSDWEPAAPAQTGMAKVNMADWEPAAKDEAPLAGPFKNALTKMFPGIAAKMNPNPPEAVDPTFDNPLFKAAGAVGAKINAPIQHGIESLAESAGRHLPGPAAAYVDANLVAPAVAARAYLPTTKEEAGASFLSGLGIPAALYDRLRPAPPESAPAVASAPPPAPAPAPEFTPPGMGAKIVGQGIRAASGVPEKYATAAAGDLDLLARAKSAEEVGKAYEKFEKTHGIKGLQGVMEEQWNDFSGSELKDRVFSAARALSAGKPVDKQELYVASQAARALSAKAKTMDPASLSAIQSGLVDKAKALIDPALEKLAPGYKQLRTDAFEQKVAEAFEHWFPQNQNQSPNVLRTGAAVGAAAAGHPGLLAVVSPKMQGYGLRAAGAVKNAVQAAGGAAKAGIAPAADQAVARAGLALGSGRPESGADVAPMVQSPDKIAMLLRANTVNPGKSGTWGAELRGIGLPSSMVSGSGKNSISDLARLLHEAGAINEDDEGEAVKYLKSIAGKVK